MKKLGVILFFVLAVGCAPRLMVMNNGAPVPNNTVRLKNDSSGLTVQFNFRLVNKLGEESYDFEFPDFNKKVYLSDDATAVYLDVWVYNPKGHEYKVNKLVETKSGFKHNTADRQIYKGSANSRRFQLTGPLKENLEVRLAAIIKVGKLPLFFAGEAWYKLREEVRFDYYDDYGR